MALEIDAVPRPDWSPLPFEGCHEVEGKVLLVLDHLSVAMLRFRPHGTIHEHPAPHDSDVVCLEGRGMASVGGEQSELRAGERVRFPANVPHRLWTGDNEMMTLMIEHLGTAT